MEDQKCQDSKSAKKSSRLSDLQKNLQVCWSLNLLDASRMSHGDNRVIYCKQRPKCPQIKSNGLLKKKKRDPAKNLKNIPPAQMLIVVLLGLLKRSAAFPQ